MIAYLCLSIVQHRTKNRCSLPLKVTQNKDNLPFLGVPDSIHAKRLKTSSNRVGFHNYSMTDTQTTLTYFYAQKYASLFPREDVPIAQDYFRLVLRYMTDINGCNRWYERI